MVLVHCNRAHWLLVLCTFSSFPLQCNCKLLHLFSWEFFHNWETCFGCPFFILSVNDLHTSWNPQLWTDWNWSISIPAPLAKYWDKSGMSNCLPWDPPEGLTAFTSNRSWFDYLPFVRRLLFLIWLFSISLPFINLMNSALESLSQDLFWGTPIKT